MKISTIITLLILTLAITSCNKTETYSVQNWSVEVNSTDGIVAFANNDLGVVLNNTKLFLKKENKNLQLQKWKYKVENEVLSISTTNPEIKWTIKISETGIDFSCSSPFGFVTGLAPAAEKRIPARVKEQDNDVMYTQMGFVSATNIHRLFDMNTDIMIQFSSDSRLSRNVEDNTLMEVSFAPVDGEEITLIHNYYDNVVGLSNYDIKDYKPAFSPIADRFKSAPTGWSSWYCYYMSPTEESLFRETDAIASKLKPYGLKYIQLDAAYTRGDEGNWLEWHKGLYPSGGKVWFDHVIKNGLTPGLWMNISGANYMKPAMADKYPDNFYLKDGKGEMSAVCCSADKTVKRLDFTNPEVFEKHLKPLFETLVNEWGLGYLKAGGWGTWMDFFEKHKELAFNSDANSRELYRKTLETVRDILGDDGYLLGCAMHEIGVGFDYFDGSRTGGDDYATWSGKNHWSGGMQTFFNSLFGVNYLNGVAWWSDPDDVMVRDPLTMNEGQTIVSTISLSGQAYIFSDFVAEFSKERLDNFLNSKYNIGWAKNFPDLVKPLPKEKLALYQKTMPSMPIKAMDLYPYKTKPKCCPRPKSFPKALDLKVNALTGQYDVVSMYNWADVDTIKTLDLSSDLGLEKDGKYVAFDFWNSKLISINSNRIEELVPSHGTKAIIIRPATVHPQLMATSRHLTAAYSIKYYKWDDDSKTMSGKSDVVPGDSYKLYIYLNENTNIKEIKINSSVEASIKQIEPNLIAVAFSPEENSINWTIHF